MIKVTDKKEIVKDLIFYMTFCALSAYSFYDSIISFFILILFAPVFVAKRKRGAIAAKKEILKLQFCEMIDRISTSLSAGISIENSLIESRNEMEKMFGENSVIVKETDEMIRKMEVNIPLSICFEEFSNRTGIEDICDFSTIFSEAIKSGGNLVEIVRNTVSIIQEKKRIEDEIKAMLNGKLLEQKVVCIIPFLILIYLKASNAEYMKVMYHNLQGVIIMTICLILYIISILLSEKIVSIKV